MSSGQTKCALTGLQWALGIVILIEAVRFVLPSAAHDFARTHMPGFVRLVLGFGEIIGCVLLLIPRTTTRGAWLLVAVFAFGILIHLLHGMYGIGNLVIYAALPSSSRVAKETSTNAPMESGMTNAELIHCFEADTPPGAFHHGDHVRLAFAYLSEYPVLQALERFAAALKRYAQARGKSQLYNETITHAYFFLIRERMARSTVTEWDEFALGNADLFVWKSGILSRYYHEATLQSDLARSVFVFPDKCG